MLDRYKISIIIPTLNAENYLSKLLERLNSQTVKDFELIIVDSSSNDNTLNIARKYTDNIISISKNKFDHGGTRTMVGKIAKGDLLIYFTQDALPYDDFTIENIIKIFKNEKVGAAYGRQISYPYTNLFGKHLREFNYPKGSYIRGLSDIPKYGIKTAFMSNSFACYRKVALEHIGWFKDGLILGEDMYAAAKMILAGYSIAYVDDARVYHSHDYTVWQEFKRYFDIGVFHAREIWLIETFGKAEGEGARYIKSELDYLLKHKAWNLLPEWVFRNFMKYVGYILGRNYNKLPKKLIKKISMHNRWWDKNF